MSEIKLLPCPFCGGRNVEAMIDENEYLYLRHFVVCNRCGSTSGRWKNAKLAIEVWNRRSEDG